MKKRRITLLFFILLLIFSCANNKANTTIETVVDKKEIIEICKDVEKCVILGDEYFKKFQEKYATNNFAISDSEETVDVTSKFEAAITLAVFDILEDDTLKIREDIADDEQEKQAREIFKYISMIIPKEDRKNIVEYEIYNNDDSSSAYVYDAYNTKDKKLIAINLDYIQLPIDQFFIETIVHEYGHAFSLDNSQKDNNIDCNIEEYEIDCYGENAYIKKFYDRFWSKYPKEWEGEKTADQLEEFYEKNKNNFLNSYAANDVYEDFAESFAAFVLKYDSQVTTVKDIEYFKKVAFFYEIPEMVLLRSKILYNLSLL